MANCVRCGKFILFAKDGKYCSKCYEIALCEWKMKQKAEEEQKRKAEEQRKKLQKIMQDAEEDRKRRDEERANKKRLVEERLAKANARIDAGANMNADMLDVHESKNLLKTFPDQKFIAIDFETTGLHNGDCEVIEIGAVKYYDGKEQGRFHSYIKPLMGLNEQATMVNHITWDMVKDEKTAKEVWPLFMDFLDEDAILVAHNADFDMQFMFVETMVNMEPPYPKFRVIDTLALSRNYFAGPDYDNFIGRFSGGYSSNFKLETVASYIGFDLSNAHHAVDDACASLAIIIKIGQELTRDNAEHKLSTDLFAYIRKNSPCTRESVEAQFTDENLNTINKVINELIESKKICLSRNAEGKAQYGYVKPADRK